MVLKRNHHILNFVIYISFLLIMLCKSSFLQSCLDYCLDWRSIILIEVFSVMASYGKRISIHILEALCRSLLWRVLRVHLITHTYNTLSNTLCLLHNITEIFANKRLMPVDTDTLPPPKGKTTLSHIFYNLSFWSPLPVSSQDKRNTRNIVPSLKSLIMRKMSIDRRSSNPLKMTERAYQEHLSYEERPSVQGIFSLQKRQL